MMTQTEWNEKKEKEIQALVSTTPLVIIEFYERIIQPEDELCMEYAYAVRCEATMTSWMDGNVFRWHVANMQVFHGEYDEHRIAVYEATPAIGFYGATPIADPPFSMAVMNELIAKAETLFSAQINSLLHPQR